MNVYVVYCVGNFDEDSVIAIYDNKNSAERRRDTLNELQEFNSYYLIKEMVLFS